MPRAWHLSIISLVEMPGSCHHHHGNVSVLLLAITMAMGVSPSNHQHGPNVSLLTKITMAICACTNTKLWYVGKCICAPLSTETHEQEPILRMLLLLLNEVLPFLIPV